jgi:UDP-N-acetylglucosamine acyltransferase
VASEIHTTAIVAAGAVIGDGCSIGAYAVIGPDVRMGAGNRIGPHVVLDGRTELGDENVIFQFASVGAPPQDLKYRGEPSTLTLGSRNIVREFVTLQPGTAGGGMRTTIGDGNLFMANSHIGHDSHVGSGNVIANSAAIAGHVVIRNKVTIGGLSGIHQFVEIGDQAIIGGGAMVAKDIPPYTMAQGDRARLVGLNRIGLERHGMSAPDIARLKRLYREVFFGTGALQERVRALLGSCTDFPAGRGFLEFILGSKRGVAGPRRGAGAADEEG